jgi:hypothetical protein
LSVTSGHDGNSLLSGGGGGGVGDDDESGVRKTGSFSFSVFAQKSAATGGAGNGEDGGYMDAGTQKRLIEQKLIAVDGDVVDEQIAHERAISIAKVHDGLKQVQEMFENLAVLVDEQQSDIEELTGNIDVTHEQVMAAMDNLTKADEMQKGASCIIC